MIEGVLFDLVGMIADTSRIGEYGIPITLSENILGHSITAIMSGGISEFITKLGYLDGNNLFFILDEDCDSFRLLN